ncbi:hypothetical protein BAU15_12660 [Enterococcus sp. JM4C]|uniref:MerR family transcriptional regulator n=1 Tax=Candidatus Enterococcus huntleyi TaxID=1857217 RepID=UPI00137B5B4B|nr:MerR family transcriptional regulator [Enterococcus sp. JM4C]KAF1296401.1 hypothetical protein BAU15_12660 [Enterococcus sp. JM4C]
MKTIKQVSELLGMSKVTLRYYDKIGLLKVNRAANGYRIYDEQDIHILRNIVVFKQAGFSLEDIKLLIGLYSFEEGDECNNRANEIILKNLAEMKKQISFLGKVTTIIEELLPLFETHQLYKINQETLEMNIEELFEETKTNQIEETT